MSHHQPYQRVPWRRRLGVELVVGDVLTASPHGTLRIAGFDPAPLDAETKAWMKSRELGEARIAYDAHGDRQVVVDTFRYTIYPRETHS